MGFLFGFWFGVDSTSIPANAQINPDGTPYIQPDGSYELDPQ